MTDEVARWTAGLVRLLTGAAGVPQSRVEICAFALRADAIDYLPT
jgi:hypothetical protein